jgi:hypothetical protein
MAKDPQWKSEKIIRLAIAAVYAVAALLNALQHFHW